MAEENQNLVSYTLQSSEVIPEVLDIAAKNCTWNRTHSNNFFTNGVARIGRFLSTPLSYAFAELTYVVDVKMKPGKAGQWSTAPRERIHRSLRFLRLLVLLPVALGVGLLGIGMRVLVKWNKKSLSVWCGSTPTPSTTPQGNTLHIGSYNIAGLPEFATNHNRLIPYRRRYEKLAETLRTHSFDVVCLQEAFHTDVTDRMRRKLAENYQWCVGNVGPRAMGLNSGLVVFSKHPIIDGHFWEFIPRFGDEKHANKGLLYLKIAVSPTTFVMVFTTHLNAGYRPKPGEPNTQQLREAQMRYCDHLIQSLIQREKSLAKRPDYKGPPHLGAAVFCGDMNVSPYECERNLPEGAEPKCVDREEWTKHILPIIEPHYDIDPPRHGQDGTPLSSSWHDNFQPMFTGQGGESAVSGRYNQIDHIFVVKDHLISLSPSLSPSLSLSAPSEAFRTQISLDDLHSDHCLIYKNVSLSPYNGSAAVRGADVQVDITA